MSQSWTIHGITVGTLGQRDQLRVATGAEAEAILVLLRTGDYSTAEAITEVMGEFEEPEVEPEPEPDPVPPSVKVYRFVRGDVSDFSTPPFELDYITSIDGRLHPTNSVIVDGEVRRTDYYAEASMDAYGAVTYSDLIVREDFVYTRDAIGFARTRVQTISWYLEDDTPHADTKVRTKLYERDESMREGVRRRSNIGDKLAMDLAGWLYVTQTQLANPQARIDLGREFMRQYKLSFDMFIDASSSQILYDVRDDASNAWLNSYLAPGLTIRAKILDDLNIWNLTL